MCYALTAMCKQLHSRYFRLLLQQSVYTILQFIYSTTNMYAHRVYIKIWKTSLQVHGTYK